MQFLKVMSLVALVGFAAAFAPASLPLRCSERAVSRSLRINMAKTPAGKGSNEFEKFKLPDGRVYLPGDAATDAIYGEAIKNPIKVPVSVQGVLGVALIAASVLIPTFMIKVIGGY